nr:hypothetical protein [Tanacetum cinerariifolium]
MATARIERHALCEPCPKEKSPAICQNDTSNPQRHVVPTTLLTKSKHVLFNVARPVTADVSKPLVTRLRQAKIVVTKPHSPSRRNINHSPSPKANTFSPKVTAAKAPMKSKGCDELLSYESNVSMPPSLVYDRYESGKGYHVVPPPYTRTFIPPKPDLVYHDAPTVNKTVLTAFNVKPSTTKPNKDLSQSNRPSTPISED